MKKDLSSASKYFISHYDVVRSAEDRFWRELQALLERAREQVARPGWRCHVGDCSTDRAPLLQLYRDSWIGQGGRLPEGVHVEAGVNNRDWLALNQLKVGLDVETVTDKALLLGRLESALARYEVLAADRCGCVLHRSADWRPLETVLPLTESSADQLVEVLRSFMELGALVDEALFLAGKSALWRTDLFADDPRPQLVMGMVEGHHGPGGQESLSEAGCLGSPAIAIDGTLPSNYHDQDGQSTNLMLLVQTNEIHCDDEIYLSCVVKTVKGGRIWFYGEGYQRLPDGQGEWPPVFAPPWNAVPVQAKPGWQHIGWQARIRGPEDYDFAKLGAAFFLRTQTEDAKFLINSIELGRC